MPPSHSPPDMPYRTLGRTKEVSAIGLGGWHLSRRGVDEKLALRIVRTAIDRGIGVLGMKSMANGLILKSRRVTALECLQYALSLPTSVVITGIDSLEILDQAFEAARTFGYMKGPRRKALLARTARAASKGDFELFKTTSLFDATATHPAWLGQEPDRLQAAKPR